MHGIRMGRYGEHTEEDMRHTRSKKNKEAYRYETQEYQDRNLKNACRTNTKNDGIKQEEKQNNGKKIKKEEESNREASMTMKIIVDQ